MSKKCWWTAGLLVLAMAASPTSAKAQQTQATVAGWNELVEYLRTLPDRMLAKLPEGAREDPQVRQEIGRLALEALTSQSLSALGADGDFPQFLPTIGQVLNVGQPNADTIYRSAVISPGGTYRLQGKQGSINQAVIAQLVPGGSAGSPRPHLDLSTLKTDKDGRFDLLLSETRPAGHAGDWWKLEPGTSMLMLRLVSSDWADETSPTLAIERTDKPMGRPRPSADTLEQRLRRLPKAIEMLALMFVDHHEKLRTEGFVNKVKPYSVGSGALEGQFYYEGAYDLADDEALIIESSVPSKCRYRSLILTNEIYETTDWYNNHSSLNSDQAAPDSDGKLRIVVSHKDPGVKNWVDTAGHPRGVIQGRWTGCHSQPIPEVTLVNMKDLRDALPGDVLTVSPEQRDEIIRERRRALLERPQW